MYFVRLRTIFILVLCISHGTGHHGHHGHGHHGGGHVGHNHGHGTGHHDRTSLQRHHGSGRESIFRSNGGSHDVESLRQHRPLAHVKKKGHGATQKSSICSSDSPYFPSTVIPHDTE